MHGDDALLKDFLIDAGLLSRSQLADALERAGERPLAAALNEMGVLGEDDLRRAAAHSLGVPFITLTRHDIAEDAMVLIPEPLARAHNTVAYKFGNDGIEVAVLDLSSLEHLTELKKTHRVLPRLTDARSMREALLHYQKHLKEKFGELLTAGQHVGEALIRHALYSRAGGVHIDPAEMGTLVRYQVGHALHEAFTLPEHLGAQLVAQLKSLAKLLPVVRPQEGKFKVEKDGEQIHVRVHALPQHNGESLHVRIARASPVAGLRPRGYMLESLGFHGAALSAVEGRLRKERGLVVVQGQDGAGKTTLLHTLADLLAAPHRNVLWVDSAAVARAALRHDPHAVFADDVQDPALAALLSQAALRGVLVVAGVRDASLVPHADLRVQTAVVRRLSNGQFKHMQKLSRAEAQVLGGAADFAAVYEALKEEKVIDPAVAWKDVLFAHPTKSTGSPTGYHGHIGLQEAGDSQGVIGLNLVEDGLFKAAQGETSVEEVLGLLS